MTSTNTALYEAALEFARQVEVRVDELMFEAGFSDEDANGNEVVDWDAFKTKAAVVLSNHQINDPDERADGLTADELLSAMIPDAPGSDGSDIDDPVDAKARAILARRAWGVTQPGPTGYVQRQLGKGLVMIRTAVYRGKTKTNVAFVTTNDAIVLDDSLQPVIDTMVKNAGKVHAQAKLIVSRKPELAPTAHKAIEAGTKRVAHDARIAIAELTSGGGDA